MYLENDSWEVEISEISYNPDSVDNIVCPDDCFVISDGYSKNLLLDITDIGHTIEKKIILTVSMYTPHNDFAFLDDNKLIMFLNDTVCEYDLKTEKIRKNNLNFLGSLFSVYRYHKDFILYAEMDIIRVNSNLEVLWDFSARDIFVRYQGVEPAFEMHDDYISLYDFLDNYYEIDYNGNVIKDLVN